MHKIWLKCIKALLVFLTAFVSGYATYFIVHGLFVRVLWLLDYELPVSERNFVIENGYLAFIMGFIAAIMIFLRIDKGRQRKNLGRVFFGFLSWTTYSFHVRPWRLF